jgi:hypothetical protein
VRTCTALTVQARRESAHRHQPLTYSRRRCHSYFCLGPGLRPPSSETGAVSLGGSQGAPWSRRQDFQGLGLGLRPLLRPDLRDLAFSHDVEGNAMVARQGLCALSASLDGLPPITLQQAGTSRVTSPDESPRLHLPS